MCNLLSSILMKTRYEQLAIYDSLTGLFNGRYIRSELEKFFLRYQRRKDIETSIVLADIDSFKKINDQHGHIQGDSVLSEMGKILSSQMRQNFDIIGRYGGEEFLMIMEGTESGIAYKIVERLRKKISSFSFKKIDKNGILVPGRNLSVTMSFGIAEMDLKINRYLELLANADQALYFSKLNGKNKVTIYHKDKIEKGMKN